MFYIFIKNIIKKHYLKTLNCGCFQSLLFTLSIFFILCNRDYGTYSFMNETIKCQKNTKYSSHVNSFNTSVAIYSNDLT